MAPVEPLLEATAKIVVHGDPKVGSTIELYNANNTGVRVWHWSILPPDGSEAFLADPMSSKPFFKIDRPGAYAVRLRVNAGPHESVDRTAVLVAEPGPVAGAYDLTVEGAHLVVAVTTGTSTKVRIPSGSEVEAIRELHATPLSAWLRKWSGTWTDIGAAESAREATALADVDRPSTAVAQLRELVEWLSRDGKGDLADLAARLTESIAITYGVE